MATPAHISFLAEPFDGEYLLYLQVAPSTKGKPRKGALAVRLEIRNTGADALITQIGYELPTFHDGNGGSGSGGAHVLKDWVVGAAKSRWYYWPTSEELQLPVQGTVKFSVYVDGFDQPVTKTFALKAHKNPTPAGSYRFPGSAADMKADEYFSFGPHGGGGEQHFGYDIGAVGWNTWHKDFRSYSSKNDDTNEARFAWEKPIHALADGIVLKAHSGSPNNPAPGLNRLVRTGDKEESSLTAVDIADLGRVDPTSDVSPARMMCVLRSKDDGKLKLFVHEQTEDGKQIVRLGQVQGQDIGNVNADVKVAVVNKNKAVTAVASDGSLSLTLWQISDDGKTISQRDSMVIRDVASVRIARLSFTRVICATKAATNGQLAVTVWKLLNNVTSFQKTPMGQNPAGSVGKVKDVDLAVLSTTRAATAVKTESDRLKVIVWELGLAQSDTVTTVTRKGSVGDVENVTQIALSGTSVANQLCAAVRTGAGNLKVFFWNSDADGNITEVAQREAGAVSHVTMRRFKKTTVMSAVRLQTGELRLIVWKLEDTNEIKRAAERDAGDIGIVALASVSTNHTTAATAVSQTNGALKVILWQLARSNGFIILHGSLADLPSDPQKGEMVHYWHFSDVDGSLKPGMTVKEGQLLGYLGNSGASGGPHLHIHAVKPPAMPLATLIEEVKHDRIEEPPYRPVVFNTAKAMAAPLVQGGVAKNPMSDMNDDGVAFVRYSLYPGS